MSKTDDDLAKTILMLRTQGEATIEKLDEATAAEAKAQAQLELLTDKLEETFGTRDWKVARELLKSKRAELERLTSQASAMLEALQ